MTSQPENSVLDLYTHIRTSVIVASFLLLLSLFCPPSAAQNIQLESLARLSSEPSADAARPRRVIAVESSSSDSERAAGLLSLDEATSIERSAFEQTNKTRVENGKQPLTWDPQLCRMARAHSEIMARQGFFSHETPDGLALKERARSMGIPRFRVIGENIAYNKGYADPGAFAVERWMMSSGHRANILYVGFQASAIGSYVASDGSVYLTQIFIAR